MSTQIVYTRGNSARTIVFDSATRNTKFSAMVTESPQERAASVSDGWINNPDEMTVTAMVTDYPITRSGGGIGQAAEAGRASRIVTELKAIKSEGLLCTVQSPWQNFSTARIVSIVINEDKPLSGALPVVITFKQSIIADSQTVPLVTPTERKPQPTTDKGGTATGGADAGKANKSYLATGVDGVGKGIKQMFPAVFKR